MFVLDNKVAEQFYEITQQDANGKILKMIPNNWDPFVMSMPKPSEMNRRYGRKQDENIISNTPAIIAGEELLNDEMQELYDQGWRVPNGSPATRMLQWQKFVQ